jgi:hypothetical protein
MKETTFPSIQRVLNPGFRIQPIGKVKPPHHQKVRKTIQREQKGFWQVLERGLDRSLMRDS